MPGWEVIGPEEAEMTQLVFESGGVLMAHGFETRRKRFFVREFEQECQQYFRSKFCLAVSSGTAATRIALQVLGVGPGDEVITQAFNFISTVEAIRDVGAIPIVVNCNEDLHVDVEEVTEKITPLTRAIVVVHMLGMPGPIGELRKLCRSLDIALIEDACEAVGAQYAGVPVGTLGDVGIYSFDHGKMLTTGEGGMVLTQTPELSRLAVAFHDHGHANEPGVPRNLDTQLLPGFNFRMTELQAAVGIAQLKKLPEMLRENSVRVEKLVAGFEGRFKVRSNVPESRASDDTVILTGLSSSEIRKVIEVLVLFGLGTKNVPDALGWHFAGNWSHFFSEMERNALAFTHQVLASSLAIPILLSRTAEMYHELGKTLGSIGHL